jgi:hypothetical protein
VGVTGAGTAVVDFERASPLATRLASGSSLSVSSSLPCCCFFSLVGSARLLFLLAGCVSAASAASSASSALTESESDLITSGLSALPGAAEPVSVRLCSPDLASVGIEWQVLLFAAGFVGTICFATGLIVRCFAPTFCYNVILCITERLTLDCTFGGIVNMVMVDSTMMAKANEYGRIKCEALAVISTRLPVKTSWQAGHLTECACKIRSERAISA